MPSASTPSNWPMTRMVNGPGWAAAKFAVKVVAVGVVRTRTSSDPPAASVIERIEFGWMVHVYPLVMGFPGESAFGFTVIVWPGPGAAIVFGEVVGKKPCVTLTNPSRVPVFQ